MKLTEQWSDYTIPDDLVYFRRGDQRLVTNPALAAWSLLDMTEARVLSLLARHAPVPVEIPTQVVERTLGKLVLNWLIHLPGKTPSIRQPDPPLAALYYAITEGCNLRCPYCYASSEKCLPGELTTQEALDLMAQAAAMNTRVVIFTGGEPMLRKDLFEVAGAARAHGMRAHIITNATMIRSSRTAQRFAETFNTVTVSVDGGTAVVHDRTRGAGSFDKTSRALALLNDAGVTPDINHVVTPENVDALNDLSGFLGGLRVGTVRLMHHSDLGRGVNDDYDFGWSEFMRVQEFFWTNPLANKILPEGPKPTKPCSIKGNCGMGGNEIYVNSLGDIYPCKLVTKPEHRAGNIRHKPLAELFASPVLADLRHNSVHEGQNLADCRRCYIRGACGGGCRAYHMAETGDIHRNGRHLCRVLRHSMISGLWRSYGVTGAELTADHEELLRPYLVRDDTVHPVYEDWRTAGRGRMPLPVIA